MRLLAGLDLTWWLALVALLRGGVLHGNVVLHGLRVLLVGRCGLWVLALLLLGSLGLLLLLLLLSLGLETHGGLLLHVLQLLDLVRRQTGGQSGIHHRAGVALLERRHLLVAQPLGVHVHVHAHAHAAHLLRLCLLLLLLLLVLPCLHLHGHLSLVRLHLLRHGWVLCHWEMNG